MTQAAKYRSERGSVLIGVVVFIAIAIAGLAGLSSSRVVAVSRHHGVMEAEVRAFNSAFAQIHLAMNVVNNSAYNELNHNLELRNALAGQFGGTVPNAVIIDTTPEAGENTGYGEASWLDQDGDPVFGLIRGTSVRVYAARDYIKRLQRLNGEEMIDVDPLNLSENYFILEAAGRVRNTIRLVSALVRENQPFSSFVFFQNNGTLGISGAPRGLIHSNEDVDFYFPNGLYRDGVSAVDGFSYKAGATPDNTNLRNANPEAKRIDLEEVNFDVLRDKADLFVGEPGMNAEIQFMSDGKVRIDVLTPPRFELVTKTYTYDKYVGYHYETVLVNQKVQVGTTTVTYEEQVVDHYETEVYWVWEDVKIGETTETRYREVQKLVGTQTVVKTRIEPVYEEQLVTKTRMVKVFVPYETDAGGGTTVAGSDGALGEYKWVEEEYQVLEMVQVGEKTVEYTVEEPIYETVMEAYTVTVPIYEKQKVEYTRQVPVYTTVTKTREEPVYELQKVEQEVKVNDYETTTVEYQEEVWQNPVHVDTVWVELADDQGGTIFVDGRITRLSGKLNGRVTVVSTEKVRINGNLLYVDDEGDPAMLNGGDYTQPFVRNPDYDGNSVLGVIAADDVVYTHTLPSTAQIDGTLMSVNGRVGVDGFWLDPNTKELVKDSKSARNALLTPEQRKLESAYDKVRAYRTMSFNYESLRRMGGAISNNRIMSTYIKTRADGTSYVDSGFKRGSMQFDIGLLFNPPPNFVVIPRPVLTHFAPVFLVRNDDA